MPEIAEIAGVRVAIVQLKPDLFIATGQALIVATRTREEIDASVIAALHDLAAATASAP